MKRGYAKAVAKELKHHNGEAARLLPDEAQVQNVPSARVYVFGDVDVEEDEINNDEIEMPSMRSRSKAKGAHSESKELEIFERTIAEGDTLQSIALKFRVQVSELKRVNNLIRDQDFYALQTIKVPIVAHGLISEIIAQELKDQQMNNGGAAPVLRRPSQPREERLSMGSETDYDLNSESEETKRLLVVRTLSIRDSFGKESQSKEAQQFLCKMDADIHRIVESTSTRKADLNEVTSRLTTKTIQPFVEQRKSAMFGADCGMRWWSVVALMFIIGLVTPVLIIFYVASRHSTEDHPSTEGPYGVMLNSLPNHSVR